jgi:hypothetical protein
MTHEWGKDGRKTARKDRRTEGNKQISKAGTI